MGISFNESRKIHVFVNENLDLAVFSFVKNPDYVYDPKPNSEWPPKSSPIFYSKTAFELFAPYSVEKLAEIIEEGMNAWNKLEAYTSGRKSIEEYYYKTSGYKKATLGKKLISVMWGSFDGNTVSVSLPTKAGRYYLDIKTITVAENADWIDFAKAVMELVEMDITQCSAYKVYKKRLNI